MPIQETTYVNCPRHTYRKLEPRQLRISSVLRRTTPPSAQGLHAPVVHDVLSSEGKANQRPQLRHHWCQKEATVERTKDKTLLVRVRCIQSQVRAPHVHSRFLVLHMLDHWSWCCIGDGRCGCHVFGHWRGRCESDRVCRCRVFNRWSWRKGDIKCGRHVIDYWVQALCGRQRQAVREHSRRL